MESFQEISRHIAGLATTEQDLQHQLEEARQETIKRQLQTEKALEIEVEIEQQLAEVRAEQAEVVAAIQARSAPVAATQNYQTNPMPDGLPRSPPLDRASNSIRTSLGTQRSQIDADPTSAPQDEMRRTVSPPPPTFTTPERIDGLPNTTIKTTIEPIDDKTVRSGRKRHFEGAVPSNFAHASPPAEEPTDTTEAEPAPKRRLEDYKINKFRRPSTYIGSDRGRVHDNFPTVVLIGERWVEIICAECEGNGKGAVRGMAGLRQHFIQAHNGLDTMIAYHKERPVSDADVERMMRGGKPERKIVCGVFKSG